MDTRLEVQFFLLKIKILNFLDLELTLSVKIDLSWKNQLLLKKNLDLKLSLTKLGGSIIKYDN